MIIKKINDLLFSFKKNSSKNNKIDNNTTLALETNYPALSYKAKESYQYLAQLCLPKNTRKNEVFEFINTLKNYDNDDDYLSTLNVFTDFLDDNDYHFIMSFDLNSETSNLAWRLNLALKENYNLFLALPPYEKDISISCDSVITSFDEKLRENNLQLSIIDTESDEYVFLVHYINDIKPIKTAVEHIGYCLFENIASATN